MFSWCCFLCNTSIYHYLVVCKYSFFAFYFSSLVAVSVLLEIFSRNRKSHLTILYTANRHSSSSSNNSSSTTLVIQLKEEGEEKKIYLPLDYRANKYFLINETEKIMKKKIEIVKKSRQIKCISLEWIFILCARWNFIERKKCYAYDCIELDWQVFFALRFTSRTSCLFIWLVGC